MISTTLAAMVIGTQAPLEFKVMTYNIRYGTAPDGDNAWPKRREALIDLIKKHDPDILGVQEALAGQVDELRAALPGHEVFGVGRDDGLRKGEYSAIFTRRSKMGMREGGTRWISDNPLKPGTLAFDAKITRIFTWGDFFSSGGQRFLLMNCHLDHQSGQARLLGGQQMLAFANHRPNLPAIVIGDFNSAPSDLPVQELLKNNRFFDSKPAEGPWGTFNGFKPTETGGDMIDHILFSIEWTLIDVTIDRTIVNGRVPSDHFPVIARLRLK